MVGRAAVPTGGCLKLSNPWLEIPFADYEAHMGSAGVGQAPVLGRLLREALEALRPGVVLVLFECVDWPALLPRIAMALKLGSVFSVIPQAPSDQAPAVTPTPFASLLKLEWLRLPCSTSCPALAGPEPLQLDNRKRVEERGH